MSYNSRVSSVYYLRIEAYEMPLWKVGVTCNNIRNRYCVADRQLIVEINASRSATREETEAIEHEILAEFAGDIYKGDQCCGQEEIASYSPVMF